MATSVYPNPGAPLVPASLSDLLGGEQLSMRVRRICGLRGEAPLRDIDANLLETLSPQCVASLGNEVVQRTRERWSDVVNLEERLGPSSGTIEDLAGNLQSRPRNLLLRAFGSSRTRPLSTITVAQLAAVENLGARLLLEILTTADAMAPHDPSSAVGSDDDSPDRHRGPSQAVRKSALRISRARWSPHVRAGDPRLGDQIRQIDADARTAQDAALATIDRPVTPSEARRLVRRLGELELQVARLRGLSLGEELNAVVAAIIPAPTSQQMVVDRLGLAGGAAMTLQGAGTRASVTRERVRQVEKRFRDSVAASPPWTPVLDKTLLRLRAYAPGRLSTCWEEMRQQGFVDDSLNPLALSAAARAFARETDVFIDPVHDLVLVGEIDPELESRIAMRTRTLVTHWGATTVDEVRAVLAEDGHAIDEPVARLLLHRLAGFSWLDEEAGWFWLRSGARNRLLNQIKKIMAVAGSISITELRDGVGRHHRMKGFRPPREVLAVLCEQTDLYRREDDRIVGGSDLPDWNDVLGDNEAALVDILFEHGPVMRRDDLEQLAVEGRGLNRSSFYVYLTYSPILERYAPGVYGLRGSQVTAAQVEALIPPRARTQVLQDHGWTGAGEIWVAYRVSAAAERSGVLGRPGSLKEVVRGEFELLAEDGRTVGTLVIEDNIWGLSPFFRRFGVEEGDYLVIELSLQQRTATIFAGAADLLLRFQNAE